MSHRADEFVYEFSCDTCKLRMAFGHAAAHIRAIHFEHADQLLNAFDLALMQQFSTWVRDTRKGMI